MKPPDFADFFRALWGRDPFPWQSRLATRASAGEWPDVIDLPTAAGKTAIIDIWLHCLLCDLAADSTQRKTPLRLFYVVDRRIIADAAFARAETIREKLRAASGDSPLVAAHEILGKQFDNGDDGNDDDSPLQTALLRGGVRREPQWCKNPGAAAVCCGTVDQIGSRLLFRGYGVSDRATPIHAALVGADSLIALDEAHISGAFVKTLKTLASLRGLRRPPLNGEKKLPFHFLQMTATPSEEEEEEEMTATPSEEEEETLIGLEKEDRENRVLKSRFAAKKPTRIIAIESPKASDSNPRDKAAVADSLDELVVSKLRDEAIEFAKRLGGAIAVVANTVRTARAVFESLPKESEKILLTGRMRALDRDAILKKYIARFRAENRAVGDAPLFVVATQCIEVGADFDFDAMATELAPLDCLRQRFGRLNRLGARAESPAAIVWAKGGLKTAEKRLPFYGVALRETAKHLKAQAVKDVVDFGVFAQEKQKAPSRKCFAPTKYPAPLLPAYLKMWFSTNPRPSADPTPSLFLRGKPSTAEAQIVWRADAPLDLDASEETVEVWRANLIESPPASGETLSLPLWTARRWLAGGGFDGAGLSDIEGGENDETAKARTKAMRVIRWRGDNTDIVAGDKINDGDVVVVAAAFGGCDEWGFNPQAKEPVEDLAEAAALAANRRKVSARFCRALDGDNWEQIAEWAQTASNRPCEEEAERLAAIVGKERAAAVEILRAARELRLLSLSEKDDYEDGFCVSGILVSARFGLALDGDNWERVREWAQAVGNRPRRKDAERLAVVVEKERAAAAEILREMREMRLLPVGEKNDCEDGFCVNGTMPRAGEGAKLVSLEDHSQAVKALARRFAAALPMLDEEWKRAVELAAEWHDAGKAAPSFQAILECDQAGVWAKSKYPPRGDRFRDRHEFISVRLAEKSDEFRAAAGDDFIVDLALWLVGVHHGHGRVLPRPPRGAEARGRKESVIWRSAQINLPHRLAEVGAGWASRAARLLRRIDPWELALLESIVRLADIVRSRREGKGENDGYDF